MSRQQTIFVTGGASGIGLAIASAILARGWRVVVADIVEKNLDTAREALNDFEAQAYFVKLDVSDEIAIESVVTHCDSEFGQITGVVNSAGIGHDIPSLDTSAELFRKILDVNLVGSFIVAREASRLMSKRGGGSIVNISSVSGVRASKGRVAYGASKAGVIMMTQVMAVELASLGIRVNAIAPGPIDTPLVKSLHPEASRAGWIDRVPQARYGVPEEIAGAAIFLLDSAMSSFVTGQTICVDGGFVVAGLMDTASRPSS